MSGSGRTWILTTVGVAALMVVIGIAIGSVAFQMTRTETTTQLSTVTAITAVVSSRPQCDRTGEGYAFYVNVIADGSKSPIAGANVTAIPFTETGQVNEPDYTCISSMIVETTGSNGSVFLRPNVGGYSITVFYQNKPYSVVAYVAAVQITNITLSLPTGNFTVGHYHLLPADKLLLM